jgi:hypothetical protein
VHRKDLPMSRSRPPGKIRQLLVVRRWKSATDGSFRRSAGLGWVITKDSSGAGPVVAQGVKMLGGKQTAFDAELLAIEAALLWYESEGTQFRHMAIHSDSQSAIACTTRSGARPEAGPGCEYLSDCRVPLPSVHIHYVGQGTRWGTQQRTSGYLLGYPATNERIPLRTRPRKRSRGRKPSSSPQAPYLGEVPNGQGELASRPGPSRHPGSSAATAQSSHDTARNALARTATQTRAGHSRSAEYLERIGKGRTTSAGSALMADRPGGHARMCSFIPPTRN